MRITSFLFNEDNKQFGLQPYYYRKTGCNANLTSNTPADQYQRLKLIQNTVRVPASLYTMNLGSLTSGANSSTAVCWNQMSDRLVPSVQRATGGVGCDIKHNSYERYLNRIKAKGPLRQGIVPADFGPQSIPFNPAFPVYGGKTTKTNIVNGCVCVK